MLYFGNFSYSPALVEKLLDRGIYCLGTLRIDRKNMVIMKKDKHMKRGDFDFQYANNVVAAKWFDNRGLWIDNRGLSQWLVHVLRNVIKYQQLQVE